LRRAVAGLSWASALYLLVRVCAFYLGIGSTRRHHLESAAFLFVLLLVPLVVTRRAGAAAAPSPEKAQRRIRAALQIAAFVAVSLIIYWPLLSAGLFADDYVIVDASREGRLTVWRELFRPVIFLVWRPMLAVTGMSAPLLHAVNIILHGINAALVALLAERLLRDRWSGLAAGGLFVLLPSGLEAVAWPSGLQDVLMTTFVLLYLVLITDEERVWWKGGVAMVALLGGLLTKETAIAAPLLAAAIGAGPELPETRHRIWKAAAVSLAVVAGFIAIRLALLPVPASYGVDLTRYGIKELLVRPFATLVVPLREEEAYRAPALAIGFVTLVVVSLRLASGRWDWQAVGFRVALVGGVMVLAAVAPVLSYFYIDDDLLGSRYLYLAQVGWVLILTVVFETASHKRDAVLVPLFGSLLVVWFAVTSLHMKIWTDAGRARDRLVAAAGRTTPDCSSWAVYGLPSTLRGVPLFINGFPEAARHELRGRIRVAPATVEAGECRLTWNGETFVRE
jgi:hypothetical protein